MSSCGLSSQVHANPSPDSSAHVTNIPPPPEAMQSDSAGAVVNYKARAQWLRAAVLGANDGLVSVASLMLGVGAVSASAKAMLVSGLAGLVAGACSMAIGEFVSVYAQYDVEMAEMKRRGGSHGLEGGGAEATAEEDQEEEKQRERLPSPVMAAAASATAFSLGAALPLVAGGLVVRSSWGVRAGVVGGASSVGLAGFGAVGAVLGGASVPRSAIRVLVGGWTAMVVAYGVLRMFGLVFGMRLVSLAG